MRTTINVDDDVLITTKNIARQEGKSVGQVLSELARRALLLPAESENPTGSQQTVDSRLKELGVVPWYVPNGKTYGDDLVDKLREEQGI